MHTIPRRPLATWLPHSALLVALAVPASACAAPPPPTVRVDAAGLDLRTQEGVSVLYGRIRLAAREVCRAHRGLTGTRVPAVFARCVRDAVDGAVYSWRLPLLAALHDELGVDRLTADPPRRKTII
jgi:UrcA family protein